MNINMQDWEKVPAHSRILPVWVDGLKKHRLWHVVWQTTSPAVMRLSRRTALLDDGNVNLRCSFSTMIKWIQRHRTGSVLPSR